MLAAVPGPLDDVSVLEIANWIAAPSATALMADMGASVVKVEPPTGDTMRNKLRQPAWPEGVRGTDVVFQLDNRGKRSIAVDLRDERGAALVRRLALASDVLVTNLLAERLVRYGLGIEALRAEHPGLIVATVSGQGTSGPDANKLAFDTTAYFGRGGVLSLLGEPGDPPRHPRPGQGDHPTSLALLVGILAALRVRDKTGQGQVVETALLRSAAWTIGADVAASLIDRRQPGRRSRTQPISPMNTRYRCADGTWLIMSSHDQGSWPSFCRAVEREDLIADPRWDTPGKRFSNGEELVALFDDVFGSAPYAHWAERLEATGLIWSEVAELPALVDDPQARHMGMYTAIEHPTAGRMETLQAPFTLSDSEVSVRGPAPDIGDDTDDVLRELGVADDEVAALREAGVVGRSEPVSPR
jgi:crotonobetainyl-CoA:carnitine CoA-transferase CaiB-like acyl-CoA transferase